MFVCLGSWNANVLEFSGQLAKLRSCTRYSPGAVTVDSLEVLIQATVYHVMIIYGLSLNYFYDPNVFTLKIDEWNHHFFLLLFFFFLSSMQHFARGGGLGHLTDTNVPGTKGLTG